nr:DUF4399 domain-containing protein [Actinomycetota bacterium]
MSGGLRRLVVVVVLGLVAASCGVKGDDSAGNANKKKATPTTVSGPSLSIVSPANGTSVKGNVVALDLSASGIRIVKADGDTTGASGHYHVFVDKPPVAAGTVIEKAAGIIHSADDPLRVTGLRAGKHTLTVVLGDGTHKRIGTAQAKVDVTIEGPALDATAPATVAAGQPLSIDVAVDGVQLAKADGDPTG